MFEEISASDLSFEWDWIFWEFEVGWFSLHIERETSSMVASEAVAKLKMRTLFWKSLIM